MGEKMTGFEVLIILALAFLIGYYTHYAVGIAAVVAYFIFRFSRTSKNRAAQQENYKKRDLETFNALGSTKEERDKTIKKMFAENQVTVKSAFLYSHRYLSVDYDIWFTLSRNLSITEPREREFLRAIHILYNNDRISAADFRYYLFAFVNGNGKAAIDHIGWKPYYQAVAKAENNHAAAKYMNENCFKDHQSVIRFSQNVLDATVDSAITNLLKIISNLEKNGSDLKDVKEIKQRLHGGGAWLSPDDLEETIFNSGDQYKIILGQLDDSDTVLTYAGEGSLITIAPPGSGKTQCFVLPNMLNWPGPAVVLDVKGEIYNATHKWRSENVGPVYKFSPLDPVNSHSYNPLTFINHDSELIWEDSRFLADMMIVPSGAADPFWENTARDILTVAIAFVCMNNGPQDRAMSKVIDIIYGIGWNEMISALKLNVEVAAMKRTGHTLGEMEKKTRDSALKVAQSSLSAWQGERIEKITKKSDWNPMDLRNGKPTIYICVNPNEIDSYLSILRVFIAQHIRVLTSKLPPRDVAPVLFMLDELPRLKKMPPVDEALNVGRQYGIKLWMFAQSFGQLKEAYPNPEGLLGSCVVRTFMNVPLNDELATKLSDLLGFREGPLDATRQKLLEPLELAGPNYRDIVLVLATNTKPAKVKKKFAYDDIALKTKMN